MTLATLATVQDYVSRARSLLQDTVEPYRYSDDDLREGLNLAITEARRLRPDLMSAYFRKDLQSFTAVDDTAVDIDPMYRLAFVYYMMGHVQLRDDENDEDARASVFLNKFNAILTQAGA